MPGRRCTAALRIPLGDPSIARSLAEALEADNRTAPSWLEVTCRADGSSLECMVEVHGCGDPRRLMSLRNTLDDLILNMRAALEAARASRE